MPNKRRKNNQERHNQISAHQKKTVDERRKCEAKGGLFTKAVPPFRANTTGKAGLRMKTDWVAWLESATRQDIEDELGKRGLTLCLEDCGRVARRGYARCAPCAERLINPAPPPWRYRFTVVEQA